MKNFSNKNCKAASPHSALKWTGLTSQEAVEFVMLDALPPLDDHGRIGWIFEGKPTSLHEKRWLELYARLTARSPCGTLMISSRVSRYQK
jgi:hypothetical protein